MARARRILHPTDFSPASGPAFVKAVELARLDKAQLLVVHVVTPPIPFIAEGYLSPGTYEEFEAAARRDAESKMGKFLSRAKRAGVRVSGTVLLGAPHAAIIEIARRKKADLIVMGTHGRTGLNHLLMGSVAERVIGRAPCPVLTVRGK